MPVGDVSQEGEPQSTLFSEVHRLCHVEGNYPRGWVKRLECPCCGSQRLTAVFQKLGIQHSRCVECDYVCVNPYPPAHLLDNLYAGNYYNKMREFYELRRWFGVWLFGAD